MKEFEPSVLRHHLGPCLGLCKSEGTTPRKSDVHQLLRSTTDGFLKMTAFPWMLTRFRHACLLSALCLTTVHHLPRRRERTTCRGRKNSWEKTLFLICCEISTSQRVSQDLNPSYDCKHTVHNTLIEVNLNATIFKLIGYRKPFEIAYLTLLEIAVCLLLSVRALAITNALPCS
jgi:hypothetical protein